MKTVLLLFGFVLLVNSYKKNIELLVLTTSSKSDTTLTSAKNGGNITSAGWGINPDGADL